MSSIYEDNICNNSLKLPIGYLSNLVNHLGQGDQPLGNTQNFKSLPFQINFKYFWNSSATGIM